MYPLRVTWHIFLFLRKMTLKFTHYFNVWKSAHGTELGIKNLPAASKPSHALITTLSITISESQYHCTSAPRISTIQVSPSVWHVPHRNLRRREEIRRVQWYCFCFSLLLKTTTPCLCHSCVFPLTSSGLLLNILIGVWLVISIMWLS